MKDFIKRNVPIFIVGGITLAIFLGIILVAQTQQTQKPLLLNLDQANFVSSHTYTKGPKDAPITLVEFSDYECPACKSYFPIVEQLAATYPNDIYVAFRQFPLPQHTQAFPAAVAAQAAGSQGKFWEYSTVLFDNQPNFTKADLIKYAGQVGLNVDQFTKDLDDPKYTTQVNEDMALGNSTNLQFTPSFFINGKLVTTDLETEIKTEIGKIGFSGQTQSAINTVVDTVVQSTQSTQVQTSFDTKYGILQIDYTSNGFSPMNTTATVGQLAHWTNKTSADIYLQQKTQVYAELKDPILIKAGETYEFRLSKDVYFTYQEKGTQAFGSIFMHVAN